jgi:hypothetical protein
LYFCTSNAGKLRTCWSRCRHGFGCGRNCEWGVSADRQAPASTYTHTDTHTIAVSICRTHRRSRHAFGCGSNWSQAQARVGAGAQAAGASASILLHTFSVSMCPFVVPRHLTRHASKTSTCAHQRGQQTCVCVCVCVCVYITPSTCAHQRGQQTPFGVLQRAPPCPP